MTERCPHCGQKMRSKQGAGYARGWTVLKLPCQKLLAWWLSNYPRDRMTKDQILSRYQRTTMTALQGRISELYALDLIKRHEKERGYTTSTYSLNLDKTVEVLNKGGKLKD